MGWGVWMGWEALGMLTAFRGEPLGQHSVERPRRLVGWIIGK
jgi:hypothetical protein